MTFDRYGNPIPPSRGQRIREWVHDLMPVLAAGLLLLGGGALLREWNTAPLPNAGVGTPAVAERPPVELMSIAQSLAKLAASPPAYPDTIVMVTPTLEPPPTFPPTATPDPSKPRPTPTPNKDAGTCPVDPSVLPEGTFCKWPQPTPTPLASCLTPVPGERCVVRRP